MKSENNAIWEAAVLWFLTGEIYEVHRWDDFRWHDVVHTKFHEERFWHSRNIKFTTSKIKVVVVLVLLMTGIS
jgi:hypothetical protein